MKVIIHLGFPKTGSSTLQGGVFLPLHKQGKLNLRTWRQEDSQERHDLRPSSRLFCSKPILDHYLEFEERNINILSDESFTAPIRLRANNFGSSLVDPIRFPALIKQQVVDRYGDDVEFKAFITIRNQAALIYSQYVEEYNLKKHKDVDIVFDDDGSVSMDGYGIYMYHRYIEELNSVFGQENVTVAFFEEWWQDVEAYSRKVAELIGLESGEVVRLLNAHHLNKKEKTSRGYYTADGKTLVPFFADKQNRVIKAFFKDDNMMLKRFLQEARLKEFNYL